MFAPSTESLGLARPAADSVFGPEEGGRNGLRSGCCRTGLFKESTPEGNSAATWRGVLNVDATRRATQAMRYGVSYQLCLSGSIWLILQVRVQHLHEHWQLIYSD